MARILQSHNFGEHQVDVLEHSDEEGTSYLVLVDHVVVTDPPLTAEPTFEDTVRIYSRSRGSLEDG